MLGGDSYPKNPDGTVDWQDLGQQGGPDDWWYQYQNGQIVWTVTFPKTGVYSDVAITDMRSAGPSNVSGGFDVGPGNLAALNERRIVNGTQAAAPNSAMVNSGAFWPGGVIRIRPA